MPVAITRPLRGAKPRKGWFHRDWRDCRDITIPGVIENVPRYLRCYRPGCSKLITQGERWTVGGCRCGCRKAYACLSLTLQEIVLLKLGWFRLSDWEKDQIKPVYDLSRARDWLNRKD